MFDGGEPSEHVAPVCCQPGGTDSVTEYPDPGATDSNVRVRATPFVSLPSSSSWKDVGLSPPPALKSKSCGSLGSASLTTTILPLGWFTNVHVTVSAGPTSMFDGGEPSEQVADERCHPPGPTRDRE